MADSSSEGGGGLPLVAASEAADAQVRTRVAGIVRRAREHYGDRLRGVVLGGSLARGQGVVLRRPEGEGLLSDIDLYLVMDAVRTSDARFEADERRRAREDPFLLAPLDLACVDAHALGALGQTLPARQLAHGSRVLHDAGGDWSRPDEVLEAGDAVDRDDATRLLLNRMAEELLLPAPADDPFRLFHRCKLRIDAPLAWLAAGGEYAPDRAEQRRRLAGRSASWPAASAEWLVRGVAHLEEMHHAQQHEILRPETLAHHAGSVGEARRWTWPFLRSLWMGGGDASLAWSAAVPEPDPGDRRWAERWLRRRSVLFRWRESRRWAPLSPLPLTPWWWHGVGGTGPDRMYLAAAWRFAGLAGWQHWLDDLIPPADGPPQGGLTPPRWLGQLWSGWMLRGSRE